MYFKHVVKHWGLLRTIITNKDACFTKRLWKVLFAKLSTRLHFSTIYHPQTNG